VPGLRYASAWAAGGWFVPLLNLFRPKQVANDIWRASDPQLRSDGWHGRDVSPWLHWWWAFWVAGGVFGNQAAFAQMQADTVSEQFRASSLAMVADILFALGAAFAIAVVSVVTLRQEARAQAMSNGARTGVVLAGSCGRRRGQPWRRATTATVPPRRAIPNRISAITASGTSNSAAAVTSASLLRSGALRLRTL
jgi:hypothetical protein